MQGEEKILANNVASAFLYCFVVVIVVVVVVIVIMAVVGIFVTVVWIMAHLKTLFDPFPFVNTRLEPSFSRFQECVSDGQTDGRTDGPTDGHTLL